MLLGSSSGGVGVVGLPVEVWRVVLAYLPLPELGRCSLVCRAWRELILSLDNTRWRQLCLGLPECPRHPNWPSRPHLEPSSWREALRQNALASRTWSRHAQPELQPSACLHLFRRRKERRVWQVGPGRELETLRAALAVAGPYDRVVLHAGVYEEQAELVMKVPVEVVGLGCLGDVALLVSLEQQCPTARFCNLVFMPAWFSTVVYKTSSGHVQLDNCNFDGAQLQVRGPGTCHARFCSFSQGSSTHFMGVALSLLDSCDFSGSDSASVTVEGAPVTERNWACKHLAALARVSTSWASPGNASPAGDSLDGQGGTPVPPGATEEENKVEEGSGRVAVNNNSVKYRLGHSRHGLSHLLKPLPDGSLPSRASPNPPSLTPELRTLAEELQRDPEAQALVGLVQGCVLRRCLFRDGKGGVHVCNHGNARMEGNVFRGLTYAVRCIQNAMIVMLCNEVCECRGSGVFLRLSAQGLIADNNIHSNGEAGLDIRKGADPIILCNRIHSGLRSGIVVLGNGRGSIRSNQIYNNKEAGVYILFNGNPVVSGNHIYQGQAAGIAVNESGRGVIVDNVIRENLWGGADIRRGGDPVLRNNIICHGYSDGVVVGERGRGLIEGNRIYCNKGCGVWVMSSSLPQLLKNDITHNRMYGLAVFCRKDPDGGPEGGGGDGGQENFHEEGELLAWESDLDSEDERHPARRIISTALVEGNCMSHNGAVGLYVKSSEPLNVVANLVNGNHGAGVAVLQSSQLTRLVANCVHGNGHGGVTVERECRVELRGNGIYDNGGHGVSFRGDGQVVENDVVGNRGYGIRLTDSADIKVLRNRVQPVQGCGIAVLGPAKAIVHDNLVFQGHPGNVKPLLHCNPGNDCCVLRNNTLLIIDTFWTCPSAPPWVLENPPPRPLFDPPNSQHPSTTGHPSHLAISMTTRITATVESGCHNNGSVFCSIL
uniref:F-box domain-containing protein n=1 Tax=Esox lucius TaxID=8010 RepID=A0A3P8XSF9_ESOLU